ncbi:hypothetical protein BLS_004317 [Venturia inaequalis]|uniref:Uncharacterized protein n=1 Tax=Venturia inaequalis TaxID=5025 RepID=A0A8H3Z4D2_VENIN|nr:hypothetical protein BLS_004317 [Venturia inaequalis]KAE9980217.1 hypothetical protein EG327_006663 [Venturia inaequalis]
MKHSYRAANLSVSSTTSASSTSSSACLSPGVSPRKGLLVSPSDYLLSPSPPLSPGLPSLIPRHGKKVQTSTRSKLRSVVMIFGAVLILTWLGTKTAFVIRSPSALRNGDYEIVSGDDLPDEPSAVIVSDSKGRKKWTVSIPPHHAFPLLPSQYYDICKQTGQIQEELALGAGKKWKHGTGYYKHDPSFVDVKDAQERGLIPNADKQGKIGDVEISDDPIAGRRPCEKSLTFVMETSDAGMGNTLMGMWTAYGLAKKEGRVFFVDDTRWPYGNYTDYFAPPPLPNCLPPPVTERLPCPHSARHLVVSAATFPFTFGPAFNTEFIDKRKPETHQEERVYQLMRVGYEKLFHLADDGDSHYALERTGVKFAEVRDKGGMNVGLQVRRGDLHPWELQYSKDYLPLTRYMDEVRDILISKYEHDDDEEHGEEKVEVEGDTANGKIHNIPHKPKSTTLAKRNLKEKRGSETPNGTGLLPRHGAPGFMASQLFLASDDPDVYSSPEVSRATRAQDRIALASKSQLEAASGGKKNQWIDEIHGWEGGFYRDQFFGLGMDDSLRFLHLGKWKASGAESEGHKGAGVMLEDENPDFLDPPTDAAMNVRRLVGRAYLLDLAVLGQSDAVVCAVSAAGCRILGVMMGWEKAVLKGLWRNVDAGAAGWRGLVVDLRD